MSKKPVTISVSSVQEHEGLREVTQRSHRGHFCERDGGTWLLWEDEGTSTTVRLETGQIRIYRRGQVNSWQDFRAGELTGGLLALGEGDAGEMVLRVQTDVLELTLDPVHGRIRLEYQLYTAASAAPDADPTEVALGRFTLDVAWDS